MDEAEEWVEDVAHDGKACWRHVRTLEVSWSEPLSWRNLPERPRKCWERVFRADGRIAFRNVLTGEMARPERPHGVSSTEKSHRECAKEGTQDNRRIAADETATGRQLLLLSRGDLRKRRGHVGSTRSVFDREKYYAEFRHVTLPDTSSVIIHAQDTEPLLSALAQLSPTEEAALAADYAEGITGDSTGEPVPKAAKHVTRLSPAAQRITKSQWIAAKLLQRLVETKEAAIVSFISPEHTLVYLENPHIQQVFANQRAFVRRGGPLTESERVMARDFQPQSAYRRRQGEAKTVEHWGQRKLLLSEIEFLLAHGRDATKVVYAGAAPGSHIAFLAETLFPHLSWLLVDPAAFDCQPTEKIKLLQDCFSDELAARLAAEEPEGPSSLLFICDIRSLDNDATFEAKEGRVSVDMMYQQKWVKLLRPKAAMLKFRLPYALEGDESVTSYLDGDVYLPVWGGRTTTECRLVVTDPDSSRDYPHKSFQDYMFHFNTETRTQYFEHSFSGIEGIDHCFDCASELLILEKYARAAGITEERALAAEIARLSESITAECSSSGRTLVMPNIHKHIMAAPLLNRGDATATLDFVDPHFHLWDTVTPFRTPSPSALDGEDSLQPTSEGADGETSHALPVHDGKLLGPPATLFPKFTLRDLSTQVAESNPLAVGQPSFGLSIVLTGAVHIEAIPNDDLWEAEWVTAMLDSDERRDAHSEVLSRSATKKATACSQLNNLLSCEVAVVARVQLDNPEAPQLVARSVNACKGRVRGVRMILNHEPSWPKVDHGAYFSDANFLQGYRALAAHGLSFDLQLNPHQMLAAAEFIARNQDVPVIVNHLGCLKLSEETMQSPSAVDEMLSSKEVVVWREGMSALAKASPAVYVKISMLCYTDANWDEEGSIVRVLVKEVIEMFGIERCMFASNYPVDAASGWQMHRLLAGFLSLVDFLELSAEEREMLFSKNARKAYRLLKCGES